MLASILRRQGDNAGALRQVRRTLAIQADDADALALRRELLAQTMLAGFPFGRLFVSPSNPGFKTCRDFPYAIANYWEKTRYSLSQPAAKLSRQASLHVPFLEL